MIRKTSMRDRSGGRARATQVEAHSATLPISDGESPGPATHIHARVPTAWLDQLLTAALDLPLFAGEHAVVEAAVAAVGGILPNCAVGVCFVPHTGEARPEQTVVKWFPEGTIESPAGLDPTRAFPGLAHEYVASVNQPTGATLHVASNANDLLGESSPIAQFADRAAIVLSRALANARAIASLDQRGGARGFEQRMLQADKLANFGQIAAGVVHELNNPLTSIVAYSDYLIRKQGPIDTTVDSDDVERLRRISESANRMLRFTRDLVSYARPSSSIAGPVVLHGVIDQAIAFCEHVLSAARVRVERRYGSDVLTLRAVGEQLVQVFVNLLTNASQAAAAVDGRVIITTSFTEVAVGKKQVVVVVEDNGVGIAPDHLPHVFVPFFTTKRNAQGTGLGLSIVKSVLESHEGAIRVESELGAGTRFVIELPVKG
jgi:two-component system NtrC family sensor kinase